MLCVLVGKIRVTPIYQPATFVLLISNMDSSCAFSLSTVCFNKAVHICPFVKCMDFTWLKKMLTLKNAENSPSWSLGKTMTWKFKRHWMLADFTENFCFLPPEAHQFYLCAVLVAIQYPLGSGHFAAWADGCRLQHLGQQQCCQSAKTRVAKI